MVIAKLRLHILSILLFAASVSHAQNFNYHFAQLLNDVDSFRPHIEQFEEIGPKSVFDPGWVNVQEWLVEYYTDLGYSTIEYDTFRASGQEQYNLVFSKNKIDHTKPYLIIGAHYDTRDGSGTNDNGSGVVATMEVAKAISKINTKRQVQFIHYAAEEAGLWGSKHHASSLPDDDSLYLMINLDQIAGKRGGENEYIIIERDENTFNSSKNEASARIADTVLRLCQLYTTLRPQIDRAFSSDYIPYEGIGKTIIGLYHNNYGNFGHSLDDVLRNMDTVTLKQTIRLSVAMGLYFAIADYPLSVESDEYGNIEVGLYPNPGSNLIQIQARQTILKCSLYDAMGHKVDEITNPSESNEMTWTLNTLPKGMYTVKVTTQDRRFIYAKWLRQ